MHNRAVDEASYPRATVLNKALEFGQKIWAVNKLKSVLERTFLPGERNELPGPSRPRPQTKSLTSLLAAERLHGTSERDPTQKRHDFRYFSKNSYFVLVEDMRQDLAIISAMEYPITKNKDGTERGTWPTLHCHPRARGPFIPYDEKEEKRFEKQELMLKQREGERIKAKTRLKQGFKRQAAKADPTVEGEEKGSTNLRRTQSMSNLHREDSLPEVTVADGTGIYESAHASGFLASGAWVAASGNSVAITSTTGTTSNAGMYNRDMPLPAKLQGSLHREVLMRRNSVVEGEAGPSNGPMGPPALPDRKKATLRKSRSTNTIKLPMRRENSKPGFCESCRVKFDDFTQVCASFASCSYKVPSTYNLAARHESTTS
jgi:regulatory subunit for Cdc7p protein kinase